ncbi:MAG: DNA phosphorothioation-associated protein 4, partial [Sphaerospermopsis kisseleviana]
EEFEKQRNEIFEEYANGGLEVLQGELKGAVDYSERILLFLQHEKLNNKRRNEEFDLTRFLS